MKNIKKKMKNIPMVSFDNISKSYGARVLFENVTFNINKGERIGLVGRNGYGKTTLMRIITGEESADDGKVSIPKNYKIGFLTLGGIQIPSDHVIIAHSDGDLVLHALSDAILGAIGANDIGELFPDNLEKTKNMSSVEILDAALKLMKEKNEKYSYG